MKPVDSKGTPLKVGDIIAACERTYRISDFGKPGKAWQFHVGKVLALNHKKDPDVVSWSQENFTNAWVDGSNTLLISRDGKLLIKTPSHNFDWEEINNGSGPDMKPQIKMKVKEIRDLIREEIKAVLKESTYSAQDLMDELSSFTTIPDSLKKSIKSVKIDTKNNKAFKSLVDEFGNGRYDEDPEIAVQELQSIVYKASKGTTLSESESDELAKDPAMKKVVQQIFKKIANISVEVFKDATAQQTVAVARRHFPNMQDVLEKYNDEAWNNHVPELVNAQEVGGNTVFFFENDATKETVEEATKLSFEDPKFKKIAVPIMNDMLEDCQDNYDGDFDEWMEYGMPNPPHNVADGLAKLEKISSEQEVEKFMAAAIERIKKYIHTGK